MTTTDLYSGYDRDGKPTSRVLRPPGGGSSNIFGNEPDPQQQLRQQEQTPVLDRNQNQSEPAARQPFQQQEDTRSANKARKPAYNPITGEEYPDDYGKKRSQAVKSEEEEDKNEETKEEKSTPTATATPGKNVRTSSRVLQPPGGATTQLW